MQCNNCAEYIVSLYGHFPYIDESCDDDCALRDGRVLINAHSFDSLDEASKLYRNIDLRNVFIAFQDREFAYVECVLKSYLNCLKHFSISKYFWMGDAK